MEIDYSNFIKELADRSWKNYKYIKENCTKEGLNEVTQLINSMYCLLVVPDEVFGYKSGGTIEKSEFSTKEKNMKRHDVYHELLSMIDELEKKKRIKYRSYGEYEKDCPVSSFIYNIRNALCHDGIGFLPINSSMNGKNEITDVIFKTTTLNDNVGFMAIFSVKQLEEFLEMVSKMYILVERGKREANEKAYREFFEGIKNDLDRFIGEYD